MSKGTYNFLYDIYGNSAAIEVGLNGVGVSNNNYINKSSAFTNEERNAFKLNAILPPAVRKISQQIKNNISICSAKVSDVEKFIYIRSLFDRNVTLAHALISADIEQYMGIIYTPTVGLACQNYSSMFRKANGLHFYPGNIDCAEDMLRLYGHRDIRVAVVTDNQGILGIGDQGVGGIAICLGKLMLYTQGAGIAPWHCLPVSLDVGTDNQCLLDDENYLGWRHSRLRGDEYVAFIQRFAKAFQNVYPKALCQWEDFSKQNAFAIRDSFMHDLISFNDDIQGTGSITLAAIFAAMKIKGEQLKEQVFLINGAGAGGVGIARQIEVALVSEGLSSDEARGKIFTLDSKGLITSDRTLEPYKERFAKDPAEIPWLADNSAGTLLNTIEHEKVTVLIGTSSQAGLFNEEIVQSLMINSDRPVIFPLSNPTDHAEARPVDLHRWTGGKALIATGSPFPHIDQDGKMVRVSQCNNVFIFPGIGLGTLASGATEVKHEFFTAAARAVSELVAEDDLAQGVLLPPVDSLKEVSYAVACAVGREAIAQGVSGPCHYSSFQHENDPERLDELIAGMRWSPNYLPLKAV